jgi:predicted NBD/HSP70 family sugar kinase
MDTSAARETNRGAILHVLMTNDRLSRGDVATLTGLSKATVSRVIDDLMASGLVREGEPLASGRRGPAPVVVELGLEDRVVCGVDMGAANTRLVFTDLLGRKVASHRHPTLRNATGPQLADWLLSLLRHGAAAFADHAVLTSAGVGVPGIVHPDGSGISGAENLPAIEGVDFLRALEKALPVVTTANDANHALLGEISLGAAGGRRSGVMITIGAGVGGGVVVDDRPLLGMTGLVGEFGYLLIPLPGGGHAAVQDLIGGDALLARGRHVGFEISSPAEIFAPGAPEPLATLRESVLQTLVTMLSATMLAYEPDVMVLGGGISPSLAPWLGDLRDRVAAASPAGTFLTLSSLGDLAGALGAVVDAWTAACLALGLPGDGIRGLASQRLHNLPKLLGISDPPAG